MAKKSSRHMGSSAPAFILILICAFLMFFMHKNSRAGQMTLFPVSAKLI